MRKIGGNAGYQMTENDQLLGLCSRPLFSILGGTLLLLFLTIYKITTARCVNHYCKPYGWLITAFFTTAFTIQVSM